MKSNGRRTTEELAGKVVQQFNNLLQVVVGNLSLLENLSAEDQVLVQEALEAGTACADLLPVMREIDRIPRDERQIDTLKRALDEFSEDFVKTAETSVSIVILGDESLAPAFERKQLFSILTPICQNAVEAMSDSGQITVEFGPTEHSVDVGFSSDTQTVSSGLMKPIRIRISDSGCGMDSEVLSRAREPFFSAKLSPRHRGLGLSVAVALVERSGGELQIRSGLGVGTRVEIVLPAGVQARVPQSERQRNSQSILVVEDEPAIRRLASGWFEREGYDVLSAENADQALAILEERGGRVDLLFTDLVMPGKMDGLQLAARVAKSYPSISLLLATGCYEVDAAESSAGVGGPWSVVSKPYRLAELSVIVAEKLKGCGD
jgi:CheY-like chemotaxis protein